jgi:hypothetical protein
VSDDLVTQDLAVVRQWWEQVAPTAPATVAGLWFGMTDLASASGTTRHLYVAGCPTFDPADETGEWATEYCWWPDDRYVVAPNLATIPESSLTDVLQHAAALVTALRPQETLVVKGAAVGFDDGDFQVVWPQ